MKKANHEVKTLPARYSEGACAQEINCQEGFFVDLPDLRIEGDKEAKAITALWRGVLMQQICDAKSRRSKPEDIYNSNQAKFWLFEGGRDFEMVCDLAGYDAQKIRNNCINALSRGWLRDGEKKQKTRLQRKLEQLQKEDELHEWQ